jgi:hypothetical protein
MRERSSRVSWARIALGLALAMAVAGFGASFLLHLGGWNGASSPPPDESQVAQSATAAAPTTAEDRDSANARTTAAAADETAPSQAPGMRVRIVQHDTDEPVADAEVLWTGVRPDSGESITNVDWEALYARSAKTTRSDATGNAVLAGQPAPAFPARSSRPIAIARQGDLYGELWNFDRRAADSVPELRVRSDATLVVQVQTASGTAAADVLVTLVGMRWPQSMPTLIQSRARSFTTDATGQVRIRHWRAASSAWSTLAHGSTHVELPSFGLRAEVAEAHDGEQHLTFRLPATGSIELDLRAAPKLLTGVTIRLTQMDGTAMLLADVTNGAGVFPFVPLACEWSISCEACGARLFTDRMHGPTVPGERVAKAIGSGDKILVSARLLTERGDVLAQQPVALEHKGARLQAASTRVDGTVLVAVDRAAIPAVSSIQWRANGHWPAPEVGRSSPELPLATTPATAIDCGDVRMAEDPLLVTGRVVDEHGQPWPLLHVQASRAPELAGLAPEALGVRMVGTTGSAFEVRGPTLDAPIQIAVTGDQWSELRDARRGDEIVIVRPRSGKLTANVLSAPPNLQLTLQRPDGRSRRASRNFTPQDGVDHFVWDQLEPGTWTLTCRLPGQSTPIVTIDDVLVAPGDNHDTRLASIDLRRVGNTAMVRLLGYTAPSSAEQSGGICWLREAGSSGPFEAVAIDVVDSHVRIAVPLRPMDARLCLLGYEPSPVQTLPLDRLYEVTLEPLATVAVVFVRDDGSACGSGIEARATQASADATSTPPLRNDTGIDADWNGLHTWARIDDSGSTRLLVARSRSHDILVAKRALGRMTMLAQWRSTELLSARAGSEPIRIAVRHDELK